MRFLLPAIAIFLIASNLIFGRWQRTFYEGDSCMYYMHVVSAFVHHDIGDYDRTITTLQEVSPSTADPRDDIYGVRLTEKGRRYIKYTLGVPLLETPFFFLGHLYATNSPKYEANGWTRPYTLAVGFAIITYLIVAFYLLIGILRRYYSDRVVALSCVALVVATNLYYQSIYVAMSHGFLFFLHVWLLHASIKFYHGKGGVAGALKLGLIVGLIALTRVPEVVAALVPIVWGVHNRKTALERLDFFRRHWGLLFPAAAAFLAVFSLQIAYWYYVSGQLVFNPYQGEGFNFLKPRFHKAFFAFDNGWLIYTPIMAFAVAGFFVLLRYARAVLLPILAFVVPHCWVHYSYYVYSYFPGLGQRPMVETYPYLVFPLAAAFTALLATKHWHWVPVTAIVLFGALNIFQTWQMREGVIWTERHNAAFYVASFGKLEPSMDAMRAFYSKSLQPDEHGLSKVTTIAVADFEDNGSGYRLGQEGRQWLDRQALPANIGGDYLKVTASATLPEGASIPGRDELATIHTAVFDEAGQRQFRRTIPISPFINNRSGSIWHLGTPGTSGEASYYVRLPGGAGQGWSVSVRVDNGGGQDIWLEGVAVEWYKNS